MPTITPTGAPDVIKKPQFVEEITEGTLPLSGPTFKSCGLVQSIGADVSIENNKIRPLGEFDVKKQVKLGEVYTSEIKFQPDNFSLMKYGMLLPISPSTTPPDKTMVAPNNTVGVSISILMSALIDGVEKYKVYTGVKFNGISGEITREGGFNVTMPFQCISISDWTVAPTFSPAATYAADPTANPWSGITSGADPLLVNSVVYDTTSFKFDIDLGVQRFRPNGITAFKYSKSFQRNLSVSWNTLVYNSVLLGDLRSYTPRTVAYTIATGKVLTFNSVRTESYSAGLEGGSTDFAMEEFSGVAEGGLTITDT
jgi:hypothetical protein